MSADRVFVDTNILVYVLDDAEPVKQRVARERLESESAAREIVVSTQVLQELYVALTRGTAPIATEEIAEQAVRNASTFTVVRVDTTLVLAAIHESRTAALSFWDALIVRAAVQAGCQTLLTEDLNHGQRYDGVRVENPFSGGKPATRRRTGRSR